MSVSAGLYPSKDGMDPKYEGRKGRCEVKSFTRFQKNFITLIFGSLTTCQLPVKLVKLSLFSLQYAFSAVNGGQFQFSFTHYHFSKF